MLDDIADNLLFVVNHQRRRRDGFAHLVKVEIALAKGKQKHDKRETEKERDWNREKQRVVRHANKGEKD